MRRLLLLNALIFAVLAAAAALAYYGYVATTVETDELAYAAPVGSYRGENTGPNYTAGQWAVLVALVLLNVLVILLAIMALTGRLAI